MSSTETFEPPVVDAHAHIFTADLPLAANAWIRPAYDFTAEDYLAMLDAHGVHFGVLAAVSVFGTYNDYVLAALRKHRRLRGTVNIDPRDCDPYSLARMRDEGVVGIRLQLARRSEMPDLADDAYRRLLRRVRDLDWHVHLAVEDCWLPGLLEQLDASGVRIVVDHLGHPDPALGVDASPGFAALLRSIDAGRTWVKLSAGYRMTWLSPGVAAPDPQAMALAGQAAARLLQVAGPERLLWGSDCPFVGHEGVRFADTLASFREWVPSARTRRQISDTALRLYFS